MHCILHYILHALVKYSFITALNVKKKIIQKFLIRIVFDLHFIITTGNNKNNNNNNTTISNIFTELFIN